jgi:hypothetical protein
MVVTLGPDTGDLSMRFGQHNGPVTAGVLQGEKSRFQLFGHSMNIAARTETTGGYSYLARDCGAIDFSWAFENGKTVIVPCPMEVFGISCANCAVL